MLFAAGGGFADDDLLGNDLAVDLTVAGNILQQQAAGGLAHETRLVLDGRELRRDVLGMHVVGEADKGHVLRDAKAELLDGGEGSKGDDVVEGKNGVGRIIALQQTEGGLQGPVVVDAVADHKLSFDGDAVLTQSLQVTVLAAAHHVEVVGTSNESNTTATSVDEMLGGFLSSHVAVGHDARELLRQTGTAKEHQGDVHLRNLLEMAVVGGVLRKTGYDALHMEADEVVDGPNLSVTLFVGVGADNGVALLGGLLLDAVEYGSIVMGHEVRHDDANHTGCFLAEALGKGVGAVVEPTGQILHTLLHLLTNLRGTAKRPADSGYTDAKFFGEVFQ